VIIVESNAVSGQPPANGLEPDTCRRSTLYGCAAAAAGIAADTARIARMTRHRLTARVARPPSAVDTAGGRTSELRAWGPVADRTVVISISL
jgi:hypothetical protein